MLKRSREDLGLPHDIFEHILDQLVGSSSSIYAVVTRVPRELEEAGRRACAKYWISLVCKLRSICESMKARVAPLFAAMSHPNQLFSYLNLDVFAQSYLLNPYSCGVRDMIRIFFHVVWARYHQPCMFTDEHRATDAVQVMTVFTQWYNRISATRKLALHRCERFWHSLAFILGEPAKMVTIQHGRLRAAAQNAVYASSDQQTRTQIELENFEGLHLLTPLAVLDKHGDL